MRYKAVVLGAGPGGLVLARELARRGIDVSIYEKGNFENLGHDWSDAVELEALNACGIELPVLQKNRWYGPLVKDSPVSEGIYEKHAIPRLSIYSPGLWSMKEIRFKMIITDRRRLGKKLLEEALEAGADIYYRHEGKGLLYREDGQKNDGGIEVFGVVVHDLEKNCQKEIKADLVVESSGFNSVLRTGLPSYCGLSEPLKDSDFALVHREVRKLEPFNTEGDCLFPDHYRYGFYNGYQWAHIHNEQSIDVGAGVRYDPGNPDPRDLIEEFIAKYPGIKNEKIRGGRSLCVVGSPLPSFVCSGFLVIGDAASTSVPTTGCGTGSAMLNGLRFGEVIAMAAMEGRNDLQRLWAINKKFYLESDRGPSYAALAALRGMLQNLEHSELDFLFTKDLLDAATLEDMINGKFRAPNLKGKAKALGSGFTDMPVLIKLNRALNTAVRIYDHYQNYPEKWDSKTCYKWKNEADKLLAARG